MRTQNVWFLKNNQSSQTEQLLYLLRKGRVLPFLSCKFWISKLFWFKLSPTPEYDFDRELACIALVAEGRWTCSELLTTSLRRLWEDLLAAVALCASIAHTSNFNLSTSSFLNTSSSSLFIIIVFVLFSGHHPPTPLLKWQEDACYSYACKRSIIRGHYQIQMPRAYRAEPSVIIVCTIYVRLIYPLRWE